MELPASLAIEVMGEHRNVDDPLHPVRLTRGLLSRHLLYACRRKPLFAFDLAGQDRFVGGLLRSPATEEALLADSPWLDEDRQKLVRYVEEGYIRRLDDGRFELAVPVISPEDDEIIAPVVDSICVELASGMLERSLNAFVSRVDEQGFGHLLTQPHYLGFIGFLMITSEVIQHCQEEGHLRKPETEAPNLGCWAWLGGRLMDSWRRGR